MVSLLKNTSPCDNRCSLGGFGYDFSDKITLTTALDVVARGILAHGVTSFCPTIVTSSAEAYKTIVPLIQKTDGKDKASILGSHLEGPFISYEKKGAHPANFVLGQPLSSYDDIERVYGSVDNVSIITMAPELDTNNIVIRELVKKGVVVSVGHSEGTLTDGERAVKSGAKFITHLFNAMLPFHHRDPGLVGLLTAKSTREKIFYGIIADGIHTHYAAFDIAFRANPSGLVLVTDAISAFGLPSGVHKISTQQIEIRQRKAFIAGTNTLCGSIASMDECVRNMIHFTGCSAVEALECASLHPAQVLGIEMKKGTLNVGSDADFVILDSDLNVLETFIRGMRVFKRKE